MRAFAWCGARAAGIGIGIVLANVSACVHASTEPPASAVAERSRVSIGRRCSMLGPERIAPGETFERVFVEVAQVHKRDVREPIVAWLKTHPVQADAVGGGLFANRAPGQIPWGA